MLRRPPLGHVLATAHDMAREFRIIAAVGTTAVPVPPALGLCTDVDVNGAPFYVMGYVDGVVLDSADKAALLDPATRGRPSADLIDVLADLHDVDVDAVGLGDLAAPRGLHRAPAEAVDDAVGELQDPRAAGDRRGRRRARRAHARAARRRRSPTATTASATASPIPPTGRIAAVLDWELCTLGDPLADVGYLGVYWTDPGAGAGRHNDPSGAEGFPTYAELLERYAARTGRDLSGIDYYVAFSSWRLAVISEGVYARYLHGAMGDQGLGPAELEAMKVGTEDLANAALEAVRRLP